MEIAGKRYRIKSSFRFTLFLIVLIVAFVFLANSALGFNDAKGLSEKQYMAVEIQAGDTLWNIAKAYMPEQNDIRKSIHMLEELNGIEASGLMAGQIIVVPIN